MNLLSTDTLSIARSLLGMEITTSFNGVCTSGYISEVEAYLGAEDKASHSYRNKRTDRTEPMFAEGGTIYVYLCYGIHEMLNLVCGPLDHPHAILIRGIIPVEGIEEMYRRRNKSRLKDLSNGPGKVCQAMGISRSQNGQRINTGDISISNGAKEVLDREVSVGPRIGIDYAGEDSLLPYRFLWHPQVD